MGFLTVLLLALVVTLCLGVATGDDSPAPPRSGASRVIRLPWHIYRHFPADFSRWEEAAAGFRGWEAEVRDLDLARTCLALMHFPETGLSARTEFGPDCADPNALGTIEWVPRTMTLVAFRMPRLLQAARAAGLQIVHIWGSDGSGPVWEASLKEAGDPPPPDPDVIERDENRWDQHTRDVFDLPRDDPLTTGAPPLVPPVITLPPEANVFVPQEGDLCASQSWQLHRLLKSRGIDHIIYCGWALNWCLWFSPGGMSDMSRKGYMCSAVRGGCVAIENRESAVGQRNLEYAYWKTSTMFGYIFDLHELTHALREAAVWSGPLDLQRTAPPLSSEQAAPSPLPGEREPG